MDKRKHKTNSGFTLIEMIIAAAMASIVILAVGIVLVNSQRAYQVTYDKVNADVMTDAFAARRLFDSIIRKSSTEGITLNEDRSSVEVHYYDTDSSSYLDRYARFYTSGLDLNVEHGIINTNGTEQTTTVNTVCTNVTSCKFMNQGSSVSMVLKLNDEQKENVMVTCAYLNN